MHDQETIRPGHGELLTAHEALEMTLRLREALDHTMYFAQVLLRYLTWEDLCVLECLLGHQEQLRLDASKTEIEQRRYLAAVERAVMASSSSAIRAMTPNEKLERLIRVKAAAIAQGKGNERKWSAAK